MHLFFNSAQKCTQYKYTTAKYYNNFFFQYLLHIVFCSYSTIQHFGLTQCCKDFYKYFGRFFTVHTVQYSILADKRPHTMLQGFLKIFWQVFLHILSALNYTIRGYLQDTFKWKSAKKRGRYAQGRREESV